MYLVPIAWLYVTLMMAIAEATNSNGTVLGAAITFVLYGALPAALVAYLMSAPARNRAIKKRNADEMARHVASLTPAELANPPSNSPDSGSHAPGSSETVAVANSTVTVTATASDGGITPVRKEP